MTVTDEPAAVRKPSYIGGLDGLRAIAVAAVIIYHFAPSVLPAGFLGVDVFFVVSGFLIARLVVAEMTGTGKVALGTFWARRARRLLPALGTMTVVVLCAVAINSTGGEKHDIRAQALGTLFYCANWVMIFAKGSYFTSIGRPSPFLHMWSLGVEEQFYVVLPLVCVAARRFIVRHPVAAAAAALAAAIASTAWMAALVSPTSDPSRAYLGSDSHAMSLLVGVALGVLAGAGGPWNSMAGRLRSNAHLARVSAAVGAVSLVGVLVVMRLATDHTDVLYRGGFLVFALLCGAVVAVVALLPAAPVATTLQSRWLVAVGLRSYSLYLWHWPVRVFVSPRPGLSGAALFVVRLVVSVALAEVSYRMVERPFRVGAVARRSGSRGAVWFFATTAVVAAVLVATVAAPVALPPSDLAQAAAQAVEHTPAPAGALRVDLFGDSTALVFGLSGATHSQELDLTVGGDARLGCGVVQDDHLSDGRVIPRPAECDGWQARWERALRHDPHAVLAVMTGAWDILDQRTSRGVVRFGTSAWTDLVRSSLYAALRILSASGRTVHLFEVPCYGAGDENDPLPERSDPRRIAALNAMFGQAARRIPHVEIVHWRTLVCAAGHRVETINGVRMWQPDGVHLTSAGGVVVWKWWLPQLRASR
jgi:peptidoglycan/LPS O-acetylase OafA/YrhL